MEYAVFMKLTIFLVWQFSATQAVRNFDILWTHSNCSALDPNFVSFFDCPIVELPKQRGNYINTSLIFQRDIHKMGIVFRVLMPSMNTGNFEILKFKTDGCNLFSVQAKNTVMNAVIKKLQQSGNFPTKCPMKAGIRYSVEHFSLNADNFPLFTPDMNFTTILNFYSVHKTFMATASVSAMVMKKERKTSALV